MAESSSSKKSAAKTKPIADVAHPGKTPPPETSRPIITKHAVLKDPMVVAEESAAPSAPAAASAAAPESVASSDAPVLPDDKKPAKAAGGELKLQPLSSSPAGEPSTASLDVSTASVSEKTPASALPELSPEPSAGPPDDEKPAEAAVAAAEPATEDTSDAGEASGSSDKPDPAQLEAAAAAQEAERDAEIQKLIDSKKYYVPVNAVERRRSKRFVVLGIIFSLILAAAWLNIALDAGLIEIPGLKPITHFFSS